MPISSNESKHDHYFEQCVVTLDTCALIEFSTMENGESSFKDVLTKYSFLIPTPVMYEFTFGIDKEGENQKFLHEIIKDIPREHIIEMDQYSWGSRQRKILPGSIFIINPGINEWKTARDRILKYVEEKGGSAGGMKKKSTFDSLIHSCARNCFTPICTENISDFNKFNYVGNLKWYDGTVPTYTVQQLIESVEKTIVFEKL